jgi:hypothetical protein
MFTWLKPTPVQLEVKETAAGAETGWPWLLRMLRFKIKQFAVRVTVGLTSPVHGPLFTARPYTYWPLTSGVKVAESVVAEICATGPFLESAGCEIFVNANCKRSLGLAPVAGVDAEASKVTLGNPPWYW